MTKDDFARLVRDEIGLDVRAEDLDTGFDDLAGWDSVHLLAILVSLEKHVNAPLSLPELLEARSLGSVYELVTR